MKFKNNILTLLILLSISAYSQEWNFNYKKAQEKAISENKSVVLVFSGSDWCAPCIKLEKRIWNNSQFQELAKEDFVMVKVDFPKRKNNKLSVTQQTHNDDLAEKYNQSGIFPLVVIVDEKGKAIKTMGYKNITAVDYYNSMKL
jgi:thioredoxin-related protein